MAGYFPKQEKETDIQLQNSKTDEPRETYTRMYQNVNGKRR